MPHNVEDVIADVEDLKGDLRSETRRKARTAMRGVQTSALGYVAMDAEWRGNLRASIHSHGVQVDDRPDGFEVSVGTDKQIAPYGPFIEFGTGSRAETTGDMSRKFPTWQPGDSVPVGYPYEAPGMSRELVAGIIEWVKTKPITPNDPADTPTETGAKIAATIANEGTRAHPFLRPAWFKHEPYIRADIVAGVRRACR